MSWWGAHPCVSKPLARAMRAEYGLHPCRECEYYYRVKGVAIDCTRCSGHYWRFNALAGGRIWWGGRVLSSEPAPRTLNPTP